jgi:hypothetical protein
MTDEQIAAMHALLAAYHRNRAKEAMLGVVQQYHADLAQRLADEAAWKASLNVPGPLRDAVT